MELTPPAEACLEKITGREVASRHLARKTDLSVVERVTMVGGQNEGQTAILKTVCPALAHESTVHEAVQNTDICAAKLLAAGGREAGHDAWLLLRDVQTEPFDEMTADEARDALLGIRGLHRAWLGRTVALSGIPRRDLTWLAEQADETAGHLRHLSRNEGLGLDDATIDIYRARLIELADRNRPRALTLVHGDFDPGNVVRLSSGSLAALDWGLAHLNTPLVDLAHMAERFPRLEQTRIAESFLNSGAATGSTEAALETGLISHRAFFVWWHSLIAANGWSSATSYVHSIRERVRAVSRTMIQ